nr:unnamed protein product [Digitaria exilis]
MPGGAPPSAPSTAPRPHEAAEEAHDKRALGEGRLKRTGGSEIEGPQMPRKVSRKSFEENESNIDHMEHYKYVDRDIQAMEKNGETCQETVKKLSTGLLGKLGKMAQGVDDLLNTAASKCRPMSTEEKIELGKLIRKLPEEALNRVVEIITRRKQASQSSDRITMKLGELDDATLWRLYYHVEYVLNENKM